MSECPDQGYKKNGNHSTTDGEEYEVKVYALLFLRAVNSAVTFEMGSNVSGVGALDDIIFRYKAQPVDDGWINLFVQIKHKNKPCTFPTGSLHGSVGDFSLYKYFKSYQLATDQYRSLGRLFDGTSYENYCAIFTNAKHVDAAAQKIAIRESYQETADARGKNLKKEHGGKECVGSDKREQQSKNGEPVSEQVETANEQSAVCEQDVSDADNLHTSTPTVKKNLPILSVKASGSVIRCGIAGESKLDTAAQKIAIWESYQETKDAIEKNLKKELEEKKCEGRDKKDQQSKVGESGSEQVETANDQSAVCEQDVSDDDCLHTSTPASTKILELLGGKASGSVIQFGIAGESERNHSNPSTSQPNQTNPRTSRLDQSNDNKTNKTNSKTNDNKYNHLALEVLKKKLNNGNAGVVIWNEQTEKTLRMKIENYLRRLLIFHGQPGVKEMDEDIKEELKKCLLEQHRYGVNFDSVFANYMDKMRALCDGTEVVDNACGVVSAAWHKTVTYNSSSRDEFSHRFSVQFDVAKSPFDKMPSIQGTETVSVILASESSTRLSVTKLLQGLEGGFLFFNVNTLTDSECRESINIEWKTGSSHTLVVTWYEGNYEENCKIMKALKDHVPKSKRLIIVLGKSEVASYSPRTYQLLEAAVKDGFDIDKLTDVSKSKVLKSKFVLQNHETRVDTLYKGKCDLAAEHMTAPAVAEILAGVRFGRPTSQGQQHEDVYIARRLERTTALEAKILLEDELTEDLLVLNSTMHCVQALIVRAKETLLPFDVEETLCEFRARPRPTGCSETFRLGPFQCKYRSTTLEGDALLLRFGPRETPGCNFRWFVFGFEGASMDHLRELCDINSNRHILRFEDGKMIWVQTQLSTDQSVQEGTGNVMRIIRKHLIMDKKMPLSPKTVADVDDKLVVICAEPGMGKTTLIRHIVNNTKSMYPSCWVIEIALNYHTKLLDDKATYTNPLKFLEAAEGITSEFQRSLLELALERIGTVAVVLDGFDEIAQTYSKQCRTLLAALLKTKVWKVWVTSRLSNKAMLENFTGTLSRSLRPFDDNEKRKYLETFLTRAKAQERIENAKAYLDGILTKGNNAVSEREQEIMGIPLQMRMLAEVYSNAKEVIPKEMDLLFLLETYFKKKKNIFIEQKVIMSTANAENNAEIIHTAEKEYDKQHKYFAVLEFFSADDLKDIELKPDVDLVSSRFHMPIKGGDDRTGIIDGIINGKPRFVHRVFAEYLVAKWITENVGTHCSTLAKNLHTPNFCVVREILDKILARDIPLHTAVLNGDVEQVRNLVDANTMDEGGRTMLHLASAFGNSKESETKVENGVKIFNLVMTYYALKGHAYDQRDKLLGFSPWQYADNTSTWYALDGLLRITSVSIDNLPGTLEVLKKEDKGALVNYFVENDFGRLLECCWEHSACEEAFEGKLRVAVDKKRLRAAKFLAEKCSKLDVEVFHAVLTRGYEDVAVALIHSKGYTESTILGESPLAFAISKRQAKVVEALIRRVAEAEQSKFVNGVDSKGQLLIHLAAMAGSSEILELLFRAGGKMTHGDRDTVLMAAAKAGKEQVVQFLLENIADSVRRQTYVNMRNSAGETALYFAMSGGHVDVIKMLVSVYKADLRRSVTTNRGTVLHDAVHTNQLKIVKEILTLIPDELVNHPDINENTALDLAVIDGHLEILQFLYDKANVRLSERVVALGANHADTSLYLMENGYEVRENNENSQKFPQAAIRAMNEPAVSAIMKERESTASRLEAADDRVNTPYILEAMFGLTNLMTTLKDEQTPDPVNTSGETVYMKAVSGGHQDALMTSIRETIKNTKYLTGKTVLHHAVLDGRKDIVEYVISHTEKVLCIDEEDCSSSHNATRNHDVDEKLLADKREKLVNARDENGNSAVHLAVSDGELMVVKLLKDAGGDLKLKNKLHQTPLMLAAALPADDLPVWLKEELSLDAADYLEMKDVNGMTIIHYAAKNGDGKMLADVLLSKSGESTLALVNHKDNSGNTALHLAASRGEVDVVSRLLEFGAIPTLTNEADETALTCAVTAGNMDTVRKLVFTTPDDNVAHKGAFETSKRFNLIVGNGNVENENVEWNGKCRVYEIAVQLGHERIAEFLNEHLEIYKGDKTGNKASE